MSREVTIPPAALARLRTVYGQFEQLVVVVAETLELEHVERVDLPRGVLIVADEVAHTNGVAV